MVLRSCGAVVFGRVLEGMPVVRGIEAMGSSSGKTRQRVIIADCGELPSRRQILAKLAAEKEALANMKKDPLQVGAASPLSHGEPSFPNDGF